MEEIDCLASELVEEEEEEEETTTVLTPDVGDLLVLQRILYAKERMREENQRDTSFIPDAPSKQKCVAWS